MRSVVGLSSCQLLSVTQCCMRQRPTHVLMLLKICWNAGKCRQGECEAVEMHGSLVSWCLLLADHQCCLYVADRRRCCHCKTVWTSTTPRTTLNTGNDRLPAGRKDKTIVIGVRERERERERESVCHAYFDGCHIARRRSVRLRRVQCLVISATTNAAFTYRLCCSGKTEEPLWSMQACMLLVATTGWDWYRYSMSVLCDGYCPASVAYERVIDSETETHQHYLMPRAMQPATSQPVIDNCQRASLWDSAVRDSLWICISLQRFWR